MTEWKLFSGSEPDFSAVPFFRDYPWVSPARQTGHAERTAMAAGLVRDAVSRYQPATLSDLGCGDGSLLELLSGLPVRMWGYDAGVQNIAIATARGQDVREADILAPGLDYGELITCCEVVEHLADPHAFIRSLPGRLLILTSPSAETVNWHYVYHAWAWDTDGYAQLIRGAGWQVQAHAECDGGVNHHGGTAGQQRFQAILAVRP